MVGIFIFAVVVLFILLGIVCWGIAIMVSRDSTEFHNKEHWNLPSHH